LADVVEKLDAVFGQKSAGNGEDRYQDVTGNLALTVGTVASG